MNNQERTLDEFIPDSTNSNNPKLEKKLKNLVEKDEAGVWGDEPNGNGVNVLRATNYGKNRIDLNDVAVRDIPDSKKESKQLKSGDIVVERSGGSANQPVGRVLFFDLEGEYYHGNFLRQLRPKTSEINSRYLYYYLDYDYKRGGTKPLQTNTTNIRNLQYSSYLNQNIPLPSISEQRKIAAVLYTVDQAIEKLDEIILQLNRTKQGLYRTLFSKGYLQHSQFKPTKYGEIPQSWNISKLTEVTSQIQAGGTPDTNVPEYYNGDIPWVKTGELSQYRVTETEQNITKKGLKESAAHLFSPGTVLIAMYGATTGEVSLLEIEAASNQACCGVVTTEKMTPEFLFHQLKYLSDHLKSLSAGSGQQNISKGIIEKFDVLVPSIEEQDSIINVLNSVDKSISKNNLSKIQYQLLKQGLMQDLFTGKVRTADTNIQIPNEVSQHG